MARILTISRISRTAIAQNLTTLDRKWRRPANAVSKLTRDDGERKTMSSGAFLQMIDLPEWLC